jgi:CubicO group peptidase (beta-lactamase class C family)
MRRSMLMAASVIVAAGGIGAEEVIVGQGIDGVLEVDSISEYTMHAPLGHFVYGEVEQHDVDVRVTLYDPSGAVVGSFDGPSRGAESFHLDTNVRGTYRIEVSAVDDQSGRYRLEVQRMEPTATVPTHRLRQLLAAFEGDDVPGAIVAVVRAGKVEHFEAVGMANLAHGIPFSRSTVSNVGSVSKQFTAFAVVSLAATEALSLEDDVREHFPELPDLGHTVTVRQLLTHTSGYREFLSLLAMSGRRLDEGDFIAREEVLQVLLRQPVLQAEPGSEFNYNNTAYSLAALMVEKVSDTTFSRWMTENAFVPLGMESTQVRAHSGQVIVNAADGYLYADHVPFRSVADLGGGGGASVGPGAIYSTVDDLARWIGNLKTARVGGTEVVRELMKPQVEASGEGNHYGLGLNLRQHRGLQLVEHSGADIAHRAHLRYYPEIDAGIVALSNHGGFPAGDIARKTAELFFADHLALEDGQDDAEGGDEQTADSAVDVSSFERFLGKYELVDIDGFTIDVFQDDDQLYAQLIGKNPEPATPTSSTRLTWTPDFSIDFALDDTDGPVAMISKAGKTYRATRLEAWNPTPRELAKFVGQYFSEELGTFYEVEASDEGLILKHRRLEDVELVPKVIDSFSGSFPIVEIAFVRDQASVVVGLLASSGRTKDIEFVRSDGGD